ncbi:hypothetical protein MMC21_002720 [Puttea exsequens]|nr:hypothetical protein [Puttea exsequens]
MANNAGDAITQHGPPGPGGPAAAAIQKLGPHLHDDQGQRIIAGMVTLIVLSTSFSTARLLSRWLARAGYWWDDVLVIVACLLSIAPCVCNLVAVSNGLGKHIFVFGPQAKQAVVDELHVLYYFQIFFYLATGSTKLAILAFYRRIFPISTLRIPWLVVTSLVAANLVGSTLFIIFQCTPIHKFWDHMQPGHCENAQNGLYITGAINTLFDFIVTLMPVPLLWRLRTSTRQKGILTGIFLTAGFVCAVSIARMIVFSKADPADVTWNFVGVANWSAVEPCVGVIGACIPSLRPLFTVLFRQPFDKSAKGASSSSGSGSHPSSHGWNTGDDKRPFSPLHDERGNELRNFENALRSHDYIVPEGRWKDMHRYSARIVDWRPEDGEEQQPPPLKGIRVRTDIVLSRSDPLPYNDRLF